jgi:phosphatidylserine decarboxylase
MTMRPGLARFPLLDEINFAVSNRIPRQLATRAFGWFSGIENPVVAQAAIAVWRMFADLRLGEAKERRFKSLNACFTRALKDGARPIDPDPAVLTSPCDAIVGASGRIRGDELLQAKGSPYNLRELLNDPGLVERYRDGLYVTLRLTPSMYHRFHAPYVGTVERVTYIAGDAWNVNPATLKRVAKLFCKNERAVIPFELGAAGHVVTLVPVAAILVASIRLRFVDTLLSARYRGATDIPCRAAFDKGEEVGWFQHGSTIIVFAPKGFMLCDGVEAGVVIRMGRALMRLP